MKLQLSMEQFLILFPEGSELEASLASGTIANYADKIASTIAARIISSAKQEAAQITRMASEKASNSLAEWDYTQSGFKLKPEIKQAIEAAAGEAIRGEAKALMDAMFSAEQLNARIDRIIEDKLRFHIDKRIDAAIAKYAAQVDLSAKIGEAILGRLKAST